VLRHGRGMVVGENEADEESATREMNENKKIKNKKSMSLFRLFKKIKKLLYKSFMENYKLISEKRHRNRKKKDAFSAAICLAFHRRRQLFKANEKSHDETSWATPFFDSSVPKAVGRETCPCTFNVSFL
jgi:hypothetical protein